MSDNKEQILDKVRKLLAMSAENGATQGEIENALAFAQKLMLKHNIDQGEVFMSPSDINIEIVENSFKHGEAKFWIWDLLCIIGECYNCKVVRNGYTDNYFYKIVGITEDRILVKALFESVLPVIRNLVKTRFKDHQKISSLSKGLFTRNYIEGFLVGLKLKLQKDKKEFLKLECTESYSLVIVQKEKLIEDFLGPMKPAKKTPERESYMEIKREGFLDGKEEDYKTKLN